jgi:hypothetical protein
VNMELYNGPFIGNGLREGFRSKQDLPTILCWYRVTAESRHDDDA